MKGKFKSRLHADSPFGVAISHWTLQPPENAPVKTGDMEWDIKLVDFGADAKSKMPDAK